MLCLAEQIGEQQHQYRKVFGGEPTTLTLHPLTWKHLLEQEAMNGAIETPIDIDLLTVATYTGLNIERDEEFPIDRVLVS